MHKIKKTMYFIALVMTFTTIFCCNKNNGANLNENEINHKFTERMWVDTKDSLNGIIFLKNQVAFYKNDKFISDSIYDYKILQRVKYVNNKKVDTKLYLKKFNYYDTLYNELIDYNDSIITIMYNNKIRNYKIN